MSCLNTNKAAGMDHLNAKFQKEAADMLDEFIVKTICVSRRMKNC